MLQYLICLQTHEGKVWVDWNWVWTMSSDLIIVMSTGSPSKHTFYCSVVFSGPRRTLGFVCTTGLDLDLEESSSLAGGSEDQQESSDSASFSIPSLELSDGVTATGNSLDVDDGLSSSYSALAAEVCSPSTEVASLRDDEMLEAAGEASRQVLVSQLSEEFKDLNSH